MEDNLQHQDIHEEPAVKRISRREFLKAATIGGLSLLAGDTVRELSSDKSSEKNLEKPASKQEIETNRLIEADMEDFADFYFATASLNEKYGAANSGYYFRKLYNPAWYVVNGLEDEIDSKNIDLAKDGWNSKSEESLTNAELHISEITVTGVEDVSDDPASFKNTQLRQLASMFAPLAVALPDNIYLTRFGRQTTDEHIATYSFKEYKLDTAWGIFFHEATHSADTHIERLKPFVNRKFFLEYATSYMTLTDELLQNSLQLPNKQAFQDFWQGTSWGADHIGPFNSQEVQDVLVNAGVASGLLSKQEGMSDLTYFYELAYSLGNKMLNIDKKKQANIKLTQEEANLLENQDVNTLMGWVVAETMHLLVYSDRAFQPNKGGRSEDIFSAQDKLNDQRIRLFASFPLRNHKDLALQVRERLGIN